MSCELKAGTGGIEFIVMTSKINHSSRDTLRSCCVANVSRPCRDSRVDYIWLSKDTGQT